jgi:hypothetical protein
MIDCLLQLENILPGGLMIKHTARLNIGLILDGKQEI